MSAALSAGVAAPSLSALLAAGVGARVLGDDAVVVRGVRRDSREVTPGDLFAALPGEQVDGAAFVEAAARAGAVAVLTPAPLEGVALPQLISDQVRRDLARAASLVYGEPSRRLAVIGLTGTNGKTTTSYLLEAILQEVGKATALIGTVAVRGPGYTTTSGYTTPEADALARYLLQAADAGATHLVMEVSSHGLELERVASVRFEVAGFTNLSQDHLDFHASMEAYGEAKARLFTEYAPRQSVICVDGEFGRQLAKRAQGELLRCSAKTDTSASDAELRVLEWSMTREGLRARLATPAGEVALRSPMVGAHNLENLLVAIGCAAAVGVPYVAAAEACARVAGAPGRLERVRSVRSAREAAAEPAVFVDYAHTPDALERTVKALRVLSPERLITVFGCGGDRDRGKRPLMAQAAAKLSDLVVLTSDNPRTEDPEAILDDVEAGFGAAPQEPGRPALGRLELADFAAPQQGSARAADDGDSASPGDDSRMPRGYVRVADRRRAIHLAIQAAGENDTVLVAGKGHEDYQILGKTKHPFDDRVEAAAALRAWHGQGGR